MILVIGPKKYVGRHFSTIEEYFGDKLKYSENYNVSKILASQPELIIVPDEHWCELGNIVSVCREKGILTLQLMDGILEWRRTWDYEVNGKRVGDLYNPINQPSIAHKIACLGRKDHRILESWGNLGKCEVVGIPRFQNLVSRSKDKSKKIQKILIVTAKTAAFTSAQMEITISALESLKSYFSTKSDIEPVWRLTGDLHEILGVENTTNDLAGGEIKDLIMEVDAVITTSSTSILEAMILQTPVAILDYHNVPHYFEAAWNIYCAEHIDAVIKELLNPPAEKLAYQNYLLDDQLQFKEDPTIRLIKLIEEMLKYKSNPENLPYCILDSNYPSKYILNAPLSFYYPNFGDIDKQEKDSLILQLNASRRTNELLERRIMQLESFINWIPGKGVIKRFIKSKLTKYKK